MNGIPPPWPHQSAAVEFALKRSGSYLDLPMGAGKTRIVVDLMDADDCRFVLIVCPKSVVEDVWPTEIPKWSRRDWEVVPWTSYNGTAVKRVEKVKAAITAARFNGRPVALVVNFDAIRSEDLEAFLKSKPWDLLVWDEAQKLKSPNGATSKAAARIARPIKRVLGMSGTPTPHSFVDLFAQYRAIDPGVLGGNFWAFRNRHAVMGGFKGKKVVGLRDKAAFAEAVAPIMFSPPPDSIELNLPPVRDIVRTVDLCPKAAKLYKALTDDVVEQHEGGMITAANGLVKLLRMQQLCSGLAVVDEIADTAEQLSDEALAAILLDQHGETKGARVEHVVCNAKRDALAELIESTSEPFVVFGWFRRDMDIVREAAEMAGTTSSELSGRARELDEWKAGHTQVIGVQMKSGAEGISLVRANLVAYLSTGFDMGAYLQSRKRAHRPGQKRPVTYYHIRARGSVDEYVARTLANRQMTVEGIIDLIAKAAALL